MAMQPERLKDGRLRVPMRAESDDGTIGDGVVVIGPDHPQYQVWSDYLDQLQDQTKPAK